MSSVTLTPTIGARGVTMVSPGSGNTIEIGAPPEGEAIKMVLIAQGPPGPAGGSAPSVATAGTATAYTAAPGLSALTGMIIVRLHVTNGSDPTLTLDAFAPLPLLLKGGVAPPSGVLPTDLPLLCEVSATAITILNEV